jgi:hypothetical protein
MKTKTNINNMEYTIFLNAPHFDIPTNIMVNNISWYNRLTNKLRCRVQTKHSNKRHKK